MLSDDDIFSAEINEMKSENPQLEQYDRVFRKIKEALAIEIQTTKKKLFDKIHELNNKTEQKFDQLYNSCDKKVRRIFDSNFNTINSKNDSEDINTYPIKNAHDININTDVISRKRNRKESEKESNIQLQAKQDQQKRPDIDIDNNQKTTKKIIKETDDSQSSRDYSDDVIFGFLEGSEEESEFLE